MKKIITLFLILISVNLFAQDKLQTSDGTDKYTIIVRADTVRNKFTGAAYNWSPSVFSGSAFEIQSPSIFLNTITAVLGPFIGGGTVYVNGHSFPGDPSQTGFMYNDGSGILQWTSTGSYVSNVTASPPLASSGGLTPNLTADTTAGNNHFATQWFSKHYSDSITSNVLRITDTVSTLATLNDISGILKITDTVSTLATIYDVSLKENLSNKSTSTSLGSSNTLYPSQGAVKTYVDNNDATTLSTANSVTALAVADALRYQGTYDQSITGLYPSGSTKGFVYKLLGSQSVNGNAVLAGDLIVCLVNGASTSNDVLWRIIPITNVLRIGEALDTHIANGKILIGDNTGASQQRTVSGDATLSNTGVLIIANNAVTNAKIANATIDLTSKVTGKLPIGNTDTLGDNHIPTQSDVDSSISANGSGSSAIGSFGMMNYSNGDGTFEADPDSVFYYDPSIHGLVIYATSFDDNECYLGSPVRIGNLAGGGDQLLKVDNLGVVETTTIVQNISDTSNAVTVPSTAAVLAVKRYKLYAAYISQASTNPPTEDAVIINELGSASWGYNSNGDYTLTITGAFTDSKTSNFTYCTNFSNGKTVAGERVSDDTYALRSGIMLGANIDEIIDHIYFEIKVYY